MRRAAATALGAGHTTATSRRVDGGRWVVTCACGQTSAEPVLLLSVAVDRQLDHLADVRANALLSLSA